MLLLDLHPHRYAASRESGNILETSAPEKAGKSNYLTPQSVDQPWLAAIVSQRVADV
jgi:hypothetical protein